MIPPIKDRMLRQIVDGIAIATANVVFHGPTGDVIDCSIAALGIQRKKEA
jgi:hypothetical protein